LLNNIDLKDKTVTDVGCGTGRHWQEIFSCGPAKLTGFDVSDEMLKMLQKKFPGAETYLLSTNKLAPMADDTCDCVVSTLTIAHIRDAGEAIAEWSRVLKPGGDIVITDYHPVALAKGGKRTFSHNNHTIAIKNYVHSIESIKTIAQQLKLEVVDTIEKNIDASAKPYYEKQNALAVFEAWNGVPIIYGMHLKKPDASL
jgi:ubiquinone/menaquinone biosynthesis C-methylase UbiE